MLTLKRDCENIAYSKEKSAKLKAMTIPILVKY